MWPYVVTRLACGDALAASTMLIIMACVPGRLLLAGLPKLRNSKFENFSK